MKETDVQTRAADAIRAALKDVPFIKIKGIRANLRRGALSADFVVDLQIDDGQKQEIVVDAKANGQPRMARDAANQLVRMCAAVRGAYGVFVAPYISPESAGICTKDGIGYLDLAGNCRLSFGKVFVRQEGMPNLFAKKRDLRSLYAPRSSRVLRVLLMRKSDWWKTQALADEAGVSLGQVANVKKLLLDREWVAEGESGFRLTNPKDLLAEWTDNYTFRKNVVREFYSMQETDAIEADLVGACRDLDIPCAFTGFSGARRLAPAVRGQRTTAYVSTIPEALLERAGLKEVPSGSNVTLMIPYDEGVYYEAREADALRIVCPVQIYLDLKGYRGRGDEAAEAIWKQVLSKLW